MGRLFLEADVLIIGGGSAGCMAAIRALELNPKLNDHVGSAVPGESCAL